MQLGWRQLWLQIPLRLATNLLEAAMCIGRLVEGGKTERNAVRLLLSNR